jgi:DNA-binding transcriptional ArsR family regulator
MDAASPDALVAGIAAAIAEPARTRILYCLLDGHARTSTELAIVAEVSPSTASVHLTRLKEQRLVKVLTQGKYRYYSLESSRVAKALEALSVIAGVSRDRFVPHTPTPLRAARTCYDHMAGNLAVALHDRLVEMDWLSVGAEGGEEYGITGKGTQALHDLGVDLKAAHEQRRRFAYACLDWSERRPHLAGALGAALLQLALQRKWIIKDLDSRALRVTPAGRRQMRRQFGLQV